jgi:preprotein translocase subunit SecE
MAKDKGNPPGGGQAPSASGVLGKIEEFKQFFEESKVEIRKVVWPSRKEAVATCIAVVVFTIAMALFLGVVDLGISKIIEAILS